MGKPPTRHQLDTALAAINQVSGFLSDGGLDPDGSRASALAAAAGSLELVRKHWTVETRKNVPAAGTPSVPAPEMSPSPATLIPDGQNGPAARNAPDPRSLEPLPGRGGR